MANYEKKYGKGYLSNVGNDKYWITENKAYKLTNNNSNDNKSNNNSKGDGFSFNQIYRLVVGVILIMVMALGFGNGTLEFLNDYKVTYAVEDFYEPNITSLADVDGKTLKFNNEITFNRFISLSLDNSKLSDYRGDILFTIFNDDNYSYDFIIDSSFDYTNYAIYVINSSNVNYLFARTPTYTKFANLNDDMTLDWLFGGNNYYITFSDFYSSVIVPTNSNSTLDNYINYLNSNYLIKSSIYSNDFFYYDWRFKLNQLSKLRPLFTYQDLNNNMRYSPFEYEDLLQKYVDDGSISFVTNGLLGDDVVYQWKINNYVYNDIGSITIKDFLQYQVIGISGDGDSSTPQFISGFFKLENGDVVPRESFIGNNAYDKWVDKYNNGELLNVNSLGFFDGVLVFLSSPINFVYNVFVLFDFVTRW